MGYTDYNNKMAEYMKARYHRRRAEWIDKLGGECVECSSEDSLEFDHIDAAEKEFAIGKILAGAAEAKLAAEMAKCQLLCRDCHIEKSKANGDYNK